MRVYKKLLLITFFFVSTVFLFSAPQKPPCYEDLNDYMYFKGKRMIYDDRTFNPVIVKSHGDKEFIFFEIFFTQPVDAASVNNECIFINEKNIRNYQIRFSKNGRGILILVPERDLLSDSESFSQFEPAPENQQMPDKPERDFIFGKNDDKRQKDFPQNDYFPLVKEYSLIIRNIKSINGSVMENLDLQNCEINHEYRFLESENLWKKF